jgi:hypothetical protein
MLLVLVMAEVVVLPVRLGGLAAAWLWVYCISGSKLAALRDTSALKGFDKYLNVGKGIHSGTLAFYVKMENQLAGYMLKYNKISFINIYIYISHSFLKEL